MNLQANFTLSTSPFEQLVTRREPQLLTVACGPPVVHDFNITPSSIQGVITLSPAVSFGSRGLQVFGEGGAQAHTPIINPGSYDLKVSPASWTSWRVFLGFDLDR